MSTVCHELKLNYSYADAVLSGEKCFEIRYNDRGFQKGDLVKFTCIDPKTDTTVVHPLNKEVFWITYLLHGFGLQEGWCVFGIKRKGAA